MVTVWPPAMGRPLWTEREEALLGTMPEKEGWAPPAQAEADPPEPKKAVEVKDEKVGTLAIKSFDLRSSQPRTTS